MIKRALPPLVIWIAIIFFDGYMYYIGHYEYESYEELFWFGISFTLFNLITREIANPFLRLALLVYCAGLLLDIIDNFTDGFSIPLLNFDTSLKNIGFLLISFGFYCMITNKRASITELKKEVERRRLLEERMRYEANHDAMTGVGSRRACFEGLQTHRFDNQWLLYLDLDNFKQVNDNYGHHIGDEVLIKFTQNMKDYFGLDYSFRIGGDEFIAYINAVLPDTDEVRAALLKGLHDYKINVSIGMVKVDPAKQADLIIHEADEHMYGDKRGKSLRSSARG